MFKESAPWFRPKLEKRLFIPHLGEVETKFAVCYLRVSTANQTKESNTGLNRQERLWNQLLEDHPDYEGWNFKFQDIGIGGIGKHQTKGVLVNYLDQAERGVIPAGTVLVADSPSRLTREKPKEALKLQLRIFDLGHKISFCSGQWRGEIIVSDTHGVWSRCCILLGKEISPPPLRKRGLWEINTYTTSSSC